MHKMASSEPPKKKLRSDDKIDLIGQVNHQIVGAKLPSNRQVLSVFFFNTRNAKIAIEISANLVAKEVEIFWVKARIPVSKTNYISKKILKLYEDYRSLQKGSYTNQSIQHQQREAEFSEELDNLFDIASSDALKVLKGEEKDFLIEQRKKGRPGCLMRVDVKGQKKEENKLKRIEEEEQRRKKSEVALKQQCNFDANNKF